MGYPIFHSQYTAAQIEASIGKTPRIKSSTRTWEIWDIATSAYVDTGVSIDTQLYVDPTLTESGYAADAKVTGDKLGELKSALNNSFAKNMIGTLTFVQGSISDTTGNDASNQYRIRSTGYVSPLAGILSSSKSAGRFYVYAYQNGTFKGAYNGTTFVSGGSALQTTVDFSKLRESFQNYDFRVVYLESGGTVTPTNVSDLTLINLLFPDNSNGEKVRLMFNNVGVFNFGDKSTKMSTADALAKMENYKQFYAEYQPNILMLEEYPNDAGTMTRFIDSSETVDPTVVLYDHIYPFSTNIYQYAVVKSDYKITFQKGLAISLPDYYYSLRGNLAEIKTPLGKILGVLSTVFDVNGTEENRAAQLAKAIEVMSGYAYSIIGVDTNMLSAEEFATMKASVEAAGYKIANGGFYKQEDTCPAAIYKPIDNIFVKGNILLKSFVVPDVLSDLSSDHLPVVSDVVIY